jgi:hypothetical protein
MLIRYNILDILDHLQPINRILKHILYPHVYMHPFLELNELHTCELSLVVRYKIAHVFVPI